MTDKSVYVLPFVYLKLDTYMPVILPGADEMLGLYSISLGCYNNSLPIV